MYLQLMCLDVQFRVENDELLLHAFAVWTKEMVLPEVYL